MEKGELLKGVVSWFSNLMPVKLTEKQKRIAFVLLVISGIAFIFFSIIYSASGNTEKNESEAGN